MARRRWGNLLSGAGSIFEAMGTFSIMPPPMPPRKFCRPHHGDTVRQAWDNAGRHMRQAMGRVDTAIAEQTKRTRTNAR